MTSMTLAGTANGPQQTMDTALAVDIVVPVYNEATDLAASVMRLHAFVRDQLPVSCRITIADNASTDATLDIAGALAERLDGVRLVHLPQKGRGRALRVVWESSPASVLAYMDVDLSTDLAALLPLLAPLLSGHSDVAIGTRLSPSARVVRGSKRELISRAYNGVLHVALGTRFSDAQCGFKAIRRDCAHRLLPLVRDDAWFFDTELLVLAERAGLRIHEVPVDWVDDVDSRVDIVPTAAADLRGVARLARDLATGRVDLTAVRDLRPGAGQPSHGLAAQVLRFATIGIASTVAYLVLYLVFRTGMSPQIRQRDRAAADRDRQYRGQPAMDVRGTWPARRLVAPRAGPERVCGCARHHVGVIGDVAHRRHARITSHRGRGARPREPRCHRCSLRCPS
jgi:hypothetical protein